MIVNNFMLKYFKHLPNDCQFKLMTKVNFKGKSKFLFNDFVEYKRDECSTLHIIGKPRWDKRKSSWIYKCKNLTNENEEISIQERFLFLKEEIYVSCNDEKCTKSVDVRTITRCKSCMNCLCVKCYKINQNYCSFCS